MRNQMQRLLGIGSFTLTLGLLGGCNTWKGLGEDFQSWGAAMRRQGDETAETVAETQDTPADTDVKVDGFPQTEAPAAETSQPASSPTATEPEAPAAQPQEAPTTTPAPAAAAEAPVMIEGFPQVSPPADPIPGTAATETTESDLPAQPTTPAPEKTTESERNS